MGIRPEEDRVRIKHENRLVKRGNQRRSVRWYGWQPGANIGEDRWLISGASVDSSFEGDGHVVHARMHRQEARGMIRAVESNPRTWEANLETRVSEG
jgi:hypothetical protein